MVQVPSAEQRAGDFNKTTPAGIYDPDTTANGIRQLFPNNRIPASRINPLSLAALQATPLPTDPGRNLFQNSSGVLSQKNNNYSNRIDYTVNANWNLFGRYSISEESAFIPATVTGRDRLNDARSQNTVAGSTYVFTSNFLNETRISFNRLLQSHSRRRHHQCARQQLPDLRQHLLAQESPHLQIRGRDISA